MDKAIDIDKKDIYAPYVVWHAPGRGLVWRGSQKVLAGLAREAVAMRAARLVSLRRAGSQPLVLEEMVKRFDYAGGEIEGLVLPRGAKVELQRLRVLTCVDSQVIAETCFETWSVLPQSGEF
jgi:hypothetical protein